MPRVITVRLLSHNPSQATSEHEPPKFLASCALSEDLIKRFPGSLLASALDDRDEGDQSVYKLDNKGFGNGFTVSFYGRKEALFNVAMDIHVNAGLDGVDLAPAGLTLEEVAVELQAFWQLPFTAKDLHAAFFPTTHQQLMLMCRYDAADLWRQMKQSLSMELHHSKADVFTRGFLTFAVAKVDNKQDIIDDSLSHRSYQVFVVNDGYINNHIFQRWQHNTQQQGATVTIDWDGRNSLASRRDQYIGYSSVWPALRYYSWNGSGKAATKADKQAAWCCIDNSFISLSRMHSTIWSQLQQHLAEQDPAYKVHAVNIALTRSHITDCEEAENQEDFMQDYHLPEVEFEASIEFWRKDFLRSKRLQLLVLSW